MSTPLKNTAFTLSFSLYKNDGTIVPNPGTYTKKVSVDGGAVADIAASVTEEDTTYGQLSLVLSAAEMNGDFIWIYVTDNTAGTVPFTCSLYPAAYNPGAEAALVHGHVTTIDGHITADYGATEKAAIDLLDDANGLVNIHDTLDDVHTDVGTAVADIAAVHVHAGTIETDVAAIHTHVNDLHDTDIPDLHTDIGTVITAVGDMHATDLPALKTVVDDIHNTDLPAVKTVVDGVETHVHSIDTTKLGTITNTGGTATVGAILGDFANTNLHTRVADLHTDVADLHMDVGTVTADVAATHVHAESAAADALAAHTAIDDATSGLAAIHTDVADVHTDIGTVDTVVDGIAAAIAAFGTTDDIADAIWDEVITDHTVSDTAGEVITAAVATVIAELAKVPKSDSNVTLNATALAAIGLALLDQSLATSDSDALNARTVRSALRALRNKSAIATGTLTVMKEDDAATAWTAAVTTDADAVPIVTVDPA
jgi:hypothetical protein